MDAVWCQLGLPRWDSECFTDARGNRKIRGDSVRARSTGWRQRTNWIGSCRSRALAVSGGLHVLTATPGEARRVGYPCRSRQSCRPENATHMAILTPRTAAGRAGMALAVHRRASYDFIMSEAIAFDTHRFVKRLTESGFTEQQAETLADEHVALLNSNLATKADIEALRLATKADIDALRQETKAGIDALGQGTKAEIDALRQETKAGIEALRQETKAEIAKVEARMETIKSDLLKWMFGAMIAQGGLIVALVKLL